MMKINVYSEKSDNFASDSEKKPMIIIESKASLAWQEGQEW